MKAKYFIYFDVGGTLLDWSDVFKSAANEFNLTIDQINDVFEENHDAITKGHISAKGYWSECIKKYDLKNAEEYDFLESWVSDYKPIKEMHELIDKLGPEYKVGLLSNIYKGMLPLLLDKGVIPDIQYDRIVFSCDTGMMKPNPDIYNLAQKKSGMPPDKILFVDDREDYLEPAKKLGWKTFLFKTKDAKNSAKELEEYIKKI
jgi:epoxide hydrolase-like predicted phosphatase